MFVFLLLIISTTRFVADGFFFLGSNFQKHLLCPFNFLWELRFTVWGIAFPVPSCSLTHTQKKKRIIHKQGKHYYLAVTFQVVQQRESPTLKTLATSTHVFQGRYFCFLCQYIPSHSFPSLFGAFSLSIIDPLFLTLQELKNASAGENHYTVFSFIMNLSSFTSTAGRCMQERLNRHKVKPELASMLMYKTDSTVMMTR